MKTLKRLLSLFIPAAFDAANMNRIHAGTKTIWFYVSTVDNVGSIQGATYFNSYADQLAVNDLILVTGSDQPEVLKVHTNDGTTVVTVALNVVG